ncbi:MAG: peptide chain release factor N(5)-glutamine methyltransferase [Thermodesulfobacteriota bacterium]|nr:peptide chain release factor N(5)-glutamine methyltransferase [Thermodesulfobacteriota bacterium]
MPPDSPAWTILEVLKWTAAFFDERHVEGAQLSAELLLAHTLGIKRLDLYLRYDQPLSPDELSAYRALIKRRARGEPVAYILGEKAFWTMTLTVAPDVLIPRPDTECLVETALAVLPDQSSDASPFRVLEMGTGSGAVIIALAGEASHCRFFALDRSTRAVAVAAGNARKQGLSGNIDFVVSDWFAALLPDAGGYDLIVVNPPYIPSAEISNLAIEIRDFEPRTALDGGQDGLRDIRHIISTAPRYLKPGGRLMIEIGWDQKAAVTRLAEAAGAYGPLSFARDLAGHDRVARLQVKYPG